MSELSGLMAFIDASPTAFHAVTNIRGALLEAGFLPLKERAVWRLTPGKAYFVTRNLSSIIAFRVPAKGFEHFQIVAAHSDSPCFKLKPSFERSGNGYVTLNVEKYGGMLMSTWMDRPLSIAGRLIVRGPGGLETRLTRLEGDAALIPNMPIHFNRDANDGVALNPQVDMLPVIASEGSGGALRARLEALCGEGEEIAGADLFLYNRDRARVWGMNEEFIAAPRLDDLECAYAGLRARVTAKPSEHIDLLAVFDNEEVGSGTRQGADSTFLEETLRRIASSLGAAPQVYEAALSRSFMVSADNAHAVHPNHADKYDQENRAFMNGGVVVKFNAAQKYTSDGLSAAVFETICRRAGVPTQRFANRSDVPGGSTLGNIANTHVSMPTVDIGLAQLAMHSAMESAGAQDLDHMVNAMRAFHETELDVRGDGRVAY